MLPFIPPENTRKTLVFWCFHGVQNGNIGQKWVNFPDIPYKFTVYILQNLLSLYVFL